MLGLSLSMPEAALRAVAVQGNTPSLPIAGGRVTSFGDSFIQNAASKSGNAVTTYSSGVMAWAEAISLGAIQFDYDRNKGVNGEKTADINARIAAGAAALAGTTDIWFYSGGRNDVTQGVDAAAAVANIKAGCAMLVALGKPVFLEIPNPPRGNATLGAGQRDTMNAVNDAIRAWAATQADVYLIDYFDDWDDGTGQPKANYTYDGLHPSRVGAFWAAKRFWNDYGSLFPPRGNTPIYTNYNAATNPFGNLLGQTNAGAYTLTGTGGQKFNAVGSLASNFKTGRYSGSSADGDVVLSKETVGDGTFRQLFAMTMTGDYAAGELIANNAFGAPPAIPPELLGKSIASEFTLEVVASNGISAFSPQVMARNNNVSVASVGLSSLDGLSGNQLSLPAGSYLLRSPPLLVAGVDATPTTWLALIGRMLSGTSGSFKITKPWYGRVS